VWSICVKIQNSIADNTADDEVLRPKTCIAQKSEIPKTLCRKLKTLKAIEIITVINMAKFDVKYIYLHIEKLAFFK
jgi:hypothetical protein